MLRVVAHKSAAAAQHYYAEGLKREDYYAQGQETKGRWHGLAAKFLGLAGDVEPEQFAALVENRHPITGERLTPRTKTDRIVGYDINFHAPKSLSVLYGLTDDKGILKAFRKAVAETMAEIEAQTATRVRKRGAAENRVTGNLAWAEFVHFTARPVGGIPDPHLHCHAFAFNCTWDSEERRWKAAKFRDIKKEAPYSEAVFHSKLSVELARLGYAIERTKTGWEIKGVPSSVLAKFSRRTEQIERRAREKGITDPKAKDALGAATREGKRRGMTWAELLAAWSVRLTDEEKVQISKVRFDKREQPGKKVTAAIREKLRERGKLGAERQFTRYEDLRWEAADRSRAENYTAGLVVQFHQNASGIKRGELFRVTGRSETGEVELLGSGGRKTMLPLDEAERFQVFAEEKIALSRGDRIRITRNGKSADDRRLNNGNVFTIERLTRKGEIVLSTGAVLAADHGHLAYGYCQTSHSSQSKSVKDVLIAQSEDSFLASSREQFYVSVSRGKEHIRIYTDSRRGLQEAVGNSSARMAGLELAGFTSDELSELMSSEMTAEKWREALERKRGQSGAESFEQRLARERRQNDLKKAAGMEWRGYIDMRRGMMGPDGKSRSKGHPVQPGKPRGRPRTGARPKTSLHTEPYREKVMATAKGEKAAPSRQQDMKQSQAKKKPSPMDRLAAKLKNAKEHFAKVKGRVTGTKPQEKATAPRSVKVGNASVGNWPPKSKAQEARVAQQAFRNRREQIAKEARNKVKVQTPTPTPRRGK